MRGGRIVSLTLVGLLLAAGLPAAQGVTPGGVSPDSLTRLSVSLSGPSGMGVNTVASFTGRVATLGSTGAPQASVTILREGAPLATVAANETGHFIANLSVSSTPGDFRVHASATAIDGTLQGESASILVKVRARPAAPTALVAAQDGAQRAVGLTWSPTPDTSGAPLLSYRITRIDAGGSAVLGSVNNTTLSFRDAGVQWNRTYRYFVQAVTYAGASAPSNFAEITVLEPVVASVTARVTRAVLCVPICDTVGPGDYTLSGSSMRLRPFVSGAVRTEHGDGISAKNVALQLAIDAGCAACTPATTGVSFTARTGLSGTYDRQPAEFSWSDFQPGECRSIRLSASGTADGITGGDVATYRICRS